MVALAVSVLCLALNAFFVAAEFALVKVRVTKLEPRVRRGERKAIAAKQVLGRLDRYLSVTQFGITVASLGLGWIGEPAIEALADGVSRRLTGNTLSPNWHVAVGVLGLGVLTFLHLLLGELVPKFVAIQHSEATVLESAIPLRIVDTTFRPILWFLEHAQRAVLRLLRINPDVANEGTLSEDEIIGILAANAAKNEAARDKQHIVERVLRMSRRAVRHAMVPRVDMAALSIDATGAEARDFLERHAFSRVPLYKGSLDRVVGYLYAKDFFFDKMGVSRPSMRGLERRAIFVPERRDGLSVLRDMQRESIPLAIVVDEYGGTSGLVTLEDLVEEVFGEIRDELDVEPTKVVRLDREAVMMWDVDARATVHELREAGVPVNEEWRDEAIGKVVVERLGHLPRVGDSVSLEDNLRAEVSATSRRRVERLRLRLVPV
ncbi:Magnesium and cobalt efflux protein CorC [Labilithrix luteola]|uniref:Magnesium and cobalt efflux protein CorC n=1 Tax=Labilithrix luteola TaxID=1391654 RepID=A0A0K1PTK3_9BACT|nr:hemolysin family protein [Labilithrix luteola]AKU96464.1 Magnesium and cobalt efflux protein CorC [Labilithrix luteola]